MGARRRVYLVLVLTLAASMSTACTGLPPLPTPADATQPVATPELPPDPLPSLGDFLIVRGYSGPYAQQVERTEELPANVAVWDDGLVVANVAPAGDSPDYRAVRLTNVELARLQALINHANLETISLPNEFYGGTCADCNVTVIQADVDGRTIEIAVYGLAVDVRPEYVDTLPVSEGVIAVAEALVTLKLIAGGQRGESWAGEMPTVHAAPIQMGG